MKTIHLNFLIWNKRLIYPNGETAGLHNKADLPVISALAACQEAGHTPAIIVTL